MSERYTMEFKLEALAALVTSGKVEKTAKAFKIRAGTLREWRDDPANRDELEQLRGKLADEIADRSMAAAHKALEQVEAKLPEASARDAAVTLGILIDKAALLRAQRPAQPLGSSDPQLLYDQLELIERLQAERRRRLAATEQAQLPAPEQGQTAQVVSLVPVAG